MILDVIKLAVGAGTHIMTNRQKRKMLESDAAMLHAQKMANGEVEYQAAVRQSNDKGWKDEFVLILVSAPVILLIWSVFQTIHTYKINCTCSLNSSIISLSGTRRCLSAWSLVYTDSRAQIFSRKSRLT